MMKWLLDDWLAAVWNVDNDFPFR